jgi:hypothetical protein
MKCPPDKAVGYTVVVVLVAMVVGWIAIYITALIGLGSAMSMRSFY